MTRRETFARPISAVDEDDAARFWRHVQKSDGCWIWMGTKNRNGYGMFGVHGEQFPAHRVAFTIVNGLIPDGRIVMHRCDVRDCVNPIHLLLGTQQDNVRDAAKKGRGTGMSSRQLTAERLRRQDAFAYLDYLQEYVALLSKKAEIGVVPFKFEEWRKKRYEVLVKKTA